ncbi:hypothetical protein PR202_ga08535 [Eleusine coracana subsp. coracana]|uniref:RRM domain-containing protein n=1 Tax=Eleusine coracana subsp. coracana TaxID=191504 RepID=A0AAV5C2G1_ELECO|nr:hypothetical protein PR202_ga08535 [Eleusine coracana subsp. coracana]
MTPRALLSRLRLAPPLHHHHLRRFLSAATLPPDESPPGAPPPPSNSRLFVAARAGLSWSTDERSLKDAFSSFGTVTEGTQRIPCSNDC